MRISKLKVENLYGIEQLELDGKSVELSGSNGMGKSSVLDAIRLALTNNSKRKCIVKNGKNEGRIFVQFDDGTTIDRKKRTDKSDYKSIKDEKGNDINSPENFLKEIYRKCLELCFFCVIIFANNTRKNLLFWRIE